jgi:hypothetical protein
VKDDPVAARDLLRPFLPEYCQLMIAGVRRGERHWANLYAQTMKLVGAQVALTVNLWQQLGANDEGHAKALIDRALEAEQMDEDTAFRVSEAFVKDYRRRHGLPELVEAQGGAHADAVGEIEAGR